MLAMGLVGVAALTVLVVSLVQGIPSPEDAYRPNTLDGRIIYLEACSKCHGAQGQGTALAPPLRGRSLKPERIWKQVESGTGRMPKFPNITAEALDNLSIYVTEIP
jgi:mono/diheme cytochrome c family protein